ncbi:uncharacterized protein LOC118408303 [Branchiostoma floridae]|uniref:Uncharacterized protein LOC118408303 n=1 Tax=Branchiostoma floridae TaxID=7739 RepID=A0A9J7KLD5_BRAFL|nr:uncharacterized protein LOC118408303 [Branchiostoma floridae]
MDSETPEWLHTQNFQCKWEGKRLKGLSDKLPAAIEDYLSWIRPSDWGDVLDQIRLEVDHSTHLDTSVTFSNNWSSDSEKSDEDKDDDDGGYVYSKRMVFCAGPNATDEIRSIHFLQFLKMALEQRSERKMPDVDGQKKFCDFVQKVENGEPYDRDEESSDDPETDKEDTEGQEQTTRKRLNLDDPVLQPMHNIDEGASGPMQLSIEGGDNARDMERVIVETATQTEKLQRNV